MAVSTAGVAATCHAGGALQLGAQSEVERRAGQFGGVDVGQRHWLRRREIAGTGSRTASGHAAGAWTAPLRGGEGTEGDAGAAAGAPNGGADRGVSASRPRMRARTPGSAGKCFS